MKVLRLNWKAVICLKTHSCIAKAVLEGWNGGLFVCLFCFFRYGVLRSLSRLQANYVAEEGLEFLTFLCNRCRDYCWVPSLSARPFVSNVDYKMSVLCLGEDSVGKLPV